MDFTIAERLNNYYSEEEIKAITFEELKDEYQGFKAVDITWLKEE